MDRLNRSQGTSDSLPAALGQHLPACYANRATWRRNRARSAPCMVRLILRHVFRNPIACFFLYPSWTNTTASCTRLARLDPHDHSSDLSRLQVRFTPCLAVHTAGFKAFNHSSTDRYKYPCRGSDVFPDLQIPLQQYFQHSLPDLEQILHFRSKRPLTGSSTYLLLDQRELKERPLRPPIAS